MISRRPLLVFVVFLLLTFLAAVFGAAFPPGDWYRSLIKPSWNPPNWIFGPVWTALYIMIAIAGWRIWRSSASSMRSRLLGLWSVQLVFNALWTPVFFGMQQLWLAFAVIAVLWLLIASFIFFAAGKDRIAAALFIPYLAWVGFAAVLNLRLAQLNS